jgi:protein disulfide-isomerase A1
MNLLSLALVVLLSLALVSAAITEEEGVLVLDDDNFDEAMSLHQHILVEFYAPWCGHCKKLEPEYKKAAGTLLDNGSETKLAKVDATGAKNLATKFDVKGFPTMKFFRSGAPMDYDGGRTAPEIVSWVTKKSGPVAQTVSTEEELLLMKEANDAFVLGYFEDDKSFAAKLFLEVAASMDHLNFAISTSDAIKSSLAIKKDTMVVMKTFDDLRNEMVIADGTDTATTLTKFIASHAVALVQIFGDETSDSIFKSPIQKHMLFFTDNMADHHQPTMESFKSVAMDKRGDLLVINVPKSESRVLEYFGITDKDLPSAVMADMSVQGTMKKFPFAGPFDKSTIVGFVGRVLAGEEKPTLKSDEPSPEDTAGDVVVVKGKTFEDIVINNTKDVLLEFYAPWCGHCKQLAPTYDALGAAFKGDDNVVIAKMDATANEIDHPNVAVRGFPTIMWFKGNDKANPTVYSKGREKKDFIEFIKSNAHNTIGDIDGGDDEDEDEEEGSDEL